MRFLVAVLLLAIMGCTTAAPPQTGTPATDKEAEAAARFRNPNQDKNNRYQRQIAEQIASQEN
jgi:hypothetical protein